MPDFVVLTDVVPEVMLEMRYYGTYNFVGTRIDGYEAPCALLTREAALAIRAACEDFAARGYRLKVYDAYRPQAAVDHFVRWAQDVNDTRMKAYFYPEVDKGALFDEGYISPHSRHSCGSTVDVTLFDMTTGRDADMGGVFDYFGVQSHSDYTSGLSPRQLENRRILRETMEEHGFMGVSTEWWHFRLRDEPYPDTYFTFPVSMNPEMC